MTVDLQQLAATIQAYAVAFGLKLLASVALWVVGGWIINTLAGLVRRRASSGKVDPTLGIYLATSLSVLLRILLVVAILGVLGVETTSFAAILAAGGVAIGVAWAGLLAHFAAGVFLVFLRPFRKGDMISAAGVTGEVTEIGMFTTTIVMADNVHVVVGNNKLFSENIVNYSASSYRAVDLRMQLAHGVDWRDAAARLRPKIAAIPNVEKTPAPVIDLFDANAMGQVLVVRPFCANAHYWDVYFAAQRIIAEVGEEAAHPAPFTVQKAC